MILGALDPGELQCDLALGPERRTNSSGRLRMRRLPAHHLVQPPPLLGAVVCRGVPHLVDWQSKRHEVGSCESCGGPAGLLQHSVGRLG